MSDFTASTKRLPTLFISTCLNSRHVFALESKSPPCSPASLGAMIHLDAVVLVMQTPFPELLILRFPEQDHLSQRVLRISIGMHVPMI